MAVAFSAGARGRGGAQQLRGRPQQRDCGGWRRAVVRYTLGRRAAWYNYNTTRAVCLVFLLPPRMQPPPLLLPRHHRCCRRLPLLSDHHCCNKRSEAGLGPCHAVLQASQLHAARTRGRERGTPAPGPGLSQRSLCSSSALRSSSVRFASSTCFFFFCGGTVRLGNHHQQRAEQRSSTRLAVGRGSVLPCPAGRPPEPTSWRTLTTRALCPVAGRNRPRQSAMTRHLPSSSSPRRAPSPAAPL